MATMPSLLLYFMATMVGGLSGIGSVGFTAGALGGVAGIHAGTVGEEVDADRYVIRDMEFIYIAQNAENEGEPEYPEFTIKRFDNNRQPRIPFEDPPGSDNWLWEAWQCKNDQCGYYREHKERFAFSNFNEKTLEWAKQGFPLPMGPDGRPAMEEYTKLAELNNPMNYQCPVCKGLGMWPERLMTDEAKALQKALIEKIMRENQL